jgi:transcriptional regulator with XRE-family HTH domain
MADTNPAPAQGAPPLASEMLTKAFGAQLRLRREERGLLQRELSVQVLGRDDQTVVSRWETGRVLPSARTLKRIHDVLALPADARATWRAAMDARNIEQAGL